MHDGRSELNTGGTLMRVIDWIYESVTSGSIELAENYILKNDGDREKSIDDLVRWHVCYAGLIGFTTGVGGVLNAAVVAPLNVSSVIAIQLRMIAAIAHLRGYSLRDQKVKALVLICLTGSSVGALLQELGYGIGAHVGKELVAAGNKSAAAKNFHRVLGRHLATRLSTSRAAPRIAPIVTGVVGSLVDAGITHGIGSTARVVFKPLHPRTGRLLVRLAA